ncbi:hypothetical protein ACFH04_01695 [Streptomyces noboritoensis]|uniref:Uncharacterized protein n=1 Tax=Streptomyces noboritoensis TaxID=67337 RepID=A0ABV6TD73_9ACTN
MEVLEPVRLETATKEPPSPGSISSADVGWAGDCPGGVRDTSNRFLSRISASRSRGSAAPSSTAARSWA